MNLNLISINLFLANFSIVYLLKIQENFKFLVSSGYVEHWPEMGPHKIFYGNFKRRCNATSTIYFRKQRWWSADIIHIRTDTRDRSNVSHAKTFCGENQTDQDYVKEVMQSRDTNIIRRYQE